MTILVACERSGIVREAFRAIGHDAWSCDLVASDDNSAYHIKGDAIKAMQSRRWDIMLAFPPCTDLAVSGARYFAQKRSDGRQQKSVAFFMEFVKSHIKKICIENPIYRKPDQIIHPWQFGHGETKATCLWLKGLPLLNPTQIVSGREQRIWKIPPGPDRARLRSQTYPGIALAMAQQWGLE